MLPKETKTTWKDWVDWAPTYLILGIALSHLVDRTKIINQLRNKLFSEKKETKTEETSDF